MRIAIIITILSLCLSTAFFAVKYQAERQKNELVQSTLSQINNVNRVFSEGIRQQQQSDAKFLALADTVSSTTAKRMHHWQWLLGKPRPAPAPADVAYRFDTVYIPVPAPDETLVTTEIVLPDTGACAEYVNRAIDAVTAAFTAPQVFEYHSPTGNLYLKGAWDKRRIRLDSVATPTRLLMSETTEPAHGVAGLLYRERTLRIEAMNPLVVITPREKYVSREPNKLARWAGRIGLFATGVATGYVAASFQK
jgi:hypothetical protein